MSSAVPPSPDWLNRLSVYGRSKEILNFAAHVPVQCRAFRAAVLHVPFPSFFSRFAEFITSRTDGRANGKRFLDYDERTHGEARILTRKTLFWHLNFLPISFAISASRDAKTLAFYLAHSK